MNIPYRLLGLARLLGYRGRVDYHAYMHSAAWKRKRQAVHERSGRTCERCGASGRRLEVHHKTYARLGHERMSDLIDLCEDCHDYVHGRKDYDPRLQSRPYLSLLRALLRRLGIHAAPGGR